MNQLREEKDQKSLNFNEENKIEQSSKKKEKED